MYVLYYEIIMVLGVGCLSMLMVGLFVVFYDGSWLCVMLCCCGLFYEMDGMLKLLIVVMVMS